MKNGIIIFNVILLLLIAVLFYLHFSATPKTTNAVAAQRSTPANNNFRIAYFEMDSLEASFAMVKDVQNELNREEDAIMAEKSRLEKGYRDKYNHYQSQGSMTQVQSDMAAKDLQETQKQIESNLSGLDQRYQELKMRKMTEVKSKIEEFLKDYNKDKGYSYIFANEPGLFYYRDTAYDITADVIRGLNERYAKNK